ncbi:polysaccharide pyruvyl transferase family protein [Vibrio splendidus]
MSSKYGLIAYSSFNIGDDIQSVAAKRFLPKVDSYIQRERVGSFESIDKTKLIMNAWWMWDAAQFPPSNSIDPLLISMYFRPEIRDKLLEKDAKEYLIKHGPVGCRDTSTAEFLNENGIPAYFSGCLTLTLKKNKEIKKEKFILTVDLPDEAVERIQSQTSYPVYNISRMLNPYFNSIDRIEIAELILYLYQSAHCVISPCLHVVLPCLALETPVLRVDIGDTTGAGNKVSTGDAKGRYSGMEHLAHKVNLADLLKGNHDYIFENPLDNPEDYKLIRNELIEKVEGFTNFDNKEELQGFKFPLVDVFRLLKSEDKMRERALYYASYKLLLKTLFNKVIRKKDRYDR